MAAEREAAGERARKASEEREAFEKKLEQEKQRLDGTSMGNGGGVAEESQDVEDAGEGGREPVRRVIREVVMVDGEMVDTTEVLREVVMIDGQMINSDEDPIAPTPLVSAKHRNRRLKRLTKKLEMKKAREDKEKEMFELSKQETEAKLSRDTAGAQSGGETSTLHPFKAPEMRYDETLLAVIGVLDQIKHESNVAGWMRSGGLLRVAHPLTPPSADGRLDEISKTEKRPAPSREGSPSGEPAKKRRIHNDPDDSDTELEIQPPPPSSPPSNIPSSPQIDETDITTPAEDDPIREEDKKEQASTGIPLSPPPLSSALGGAASGDVGPKDLWYQDHSVHRYWAERGRRALETLGIEIESGIEPVPGGLSPREGK